MTWTYDATSSGFTVQLNRVRREIGDVVLDAQNHYLLQDQEITYAGTVEGSDLSVAARCCEWLAGQFSVKADFTEGKLSIKLSQRAQAYTQKALRLRAQDAATGALPSVGGESVSEKQTNDQDTDRVPPAFWRGMLDNPEAEPLTPGSENEPDPFDQTG